jgi:hypothetical protein
MGANGAKGKVATVVTGCRVGKRNASRGSRALFTACTVKKRHKKRTAFRRPAEFWFSPGGTNQPSCSLRCSGRFSGFFYLFGTDIRETANETCVLEYT